MRSALAGALLLATTMGVCASAAPAGNELAIAKQGYLFAGGKYETVNGKKVMAGQI